MSKTSAANWIRERVAAYSKRFAASVTAYAREYRNDLFLRTEINIIGLQIAYAALIILFSVGSLFVLYHNVVSGVATAIATALTSTTTPLSVSSIMTQLEAERARQIIGVAVFIFIAAVIFGYLVARFALMPARNALTSQKQFIGNIAHELRTPLAIIKTNTEVRLLDPSVTRESRVVHESNLEELDRISDIINNLLSLNALIRPEQIPFSNVDLGKIVTRVAQKLEGMAQKKQTRIRVRIARERMVWGNASALEQIVMNVVRNAVQHTAKGEVNVSVEGDGSAVAFRVRDSGTGIAPEDLHRVFEPFYRGDRARVRGGGGGSGLGLAIVNELVKLHRGRINIQSALQKGTAVAVSLPRAHSAAKTERTKELFHEVQLDFSDTA